MDPFKLFFVQVQGKRSSARSKEYDSSRKVAIQEGFQCSIQAKLKAWEFFKNAVTCATRVTQRVEYPFPIAIKQFKKCTDNACMTQIDPEKKSCETSANVYGMTVTLADVQSLTKHSKKIVIA